MTRIAVLGCGRIGRMHANNIAVHPRAELASVFDVYTPSAEAVSADHGVPIAASADQIFASADIDAVLIATATETHADFIEQAVSAGIPVLCEKPIDLNIGRVKRCAENIRQAKSIVQLGFNRRFDPGHRAAYDAMKAGNIGDLHQVIITSRDPGLPPRDYLESAGGLLRDMTIHDFDMARYMMDEEPVEVFAIAGALVDPVLGAELDEVDSAMITLRSESGRQCQINNSRAAVYGYDQRIELLGTKGMVLSDNRKPHEMRRYTADSTEVSTPYQFFFIERYHESFMAEIDAFVDSIENNKPAVVSFEDGHKALILAEAAYRSLQEKRLVHINEVS